MIHRLHARIKRYITRFRASTFARNLAVLTSGTAIAQLLVFLSAPILSRVYTEQEFGIFAVYSTVCAILSQIASLRMEQAIPLPDSDDEAIAVVRMAQWITLAFCIITGIGIWLARDAIAAWSHEAELVQYLWLVPLTVLGFGAYKILSAWAVRIEDYKDLAYTRVAQALGQSIVQISLGIWMSGSFGLILGNAAGQWTGITRLLRPVQAASRGLQLSWSEYIALFRKYRKFPQFATPSALLMTLPRQVPSLFLFAYFGAAEAGFYFFAAKIIRQPSLLFSESFSQVFLGRAAKVRNERPAELPALYFRMIRRMLIVSLLPAALLIIAGPWLVSLIFGADWQPSGFYVQVLAVMLIAEVTMGSTSPIINVIQIQDKQLWGDLFRTAMVFASFIVPIALGWNAHAVVSSYAAAMILSYLVYFVIISRGLQAFAARERTRHEKNSEADSAVLHQTDLPPGI